MGVYHHPELFEDTDGNRWVYHRISEDKLPLLWERIDRLVEFLPEVMKGCSEDTFTWSFVNSGSDQALLEDWYGEDDWPPLGIVSGAVGPVWQYGSWHCWMKVSGYPLPSSTP